jgi:hypothetical protein
MNQRVNTCLCCGSGSVLRHIRHGKLYWFCLSCRQEIPLLTVNRLSEHLETRKTSINNSPVTSV